VLQPVSLLYCLTGRFKNDNYSPNNAIQLYQQKIKFSDIYGLSEAKNKLQEVIDYIKNSKKY